MLKQGFINSDLHKLQFIVVFKAEKHGLLFWGMKSELRPLFDVHLQVILAVTFQPTNHDLEMKIHLEHLG